MQPSGEKVFPAEGAACVEAWRQERTRVFRDWCRGQCVSIGVSRAKDNTRRGGGGGGAGAECRSRGALWTTLRMSLAKCRNHQRA